MGGSGQHANPCQSKLDALQLASVVKDIPQNVHFAFKGTVATNFLEAQGVAFATVTPGESRPSTELAEKARSFTVRVECLR